MAHAEGRPRAGWVWVVYLAHGRVHDVSFVCPCWCDKPAEKARRALQEAAFFLHPLLPETDASMLQSPEALLKTERPDWLEKGRDVSKRYGPCDKLKLACAWKVDHPGLMDKYTAGKKRVQQELEQLENRGEDVSYVPGLPVKTAPAHGFTLSQACNEVILCMASTQISCYPCCQRA